MAHLLAESWGCVNRNPDREGPRTYDSPPSSFRARPIHGSGRIAFTQSAKDGMKPRSSRTCCSPIQRTGNHPAGRERDRGAENRLRHEDSLGMVPQRAMAEVGDDLLRFVEPVMDTEYSPRPRRPICGRWTARGDTDVPWSPPSEIVAVVGGVGEPLVEIEMDAAVRRHRTGMCRRRRRCFPSRHGFGRGSRSRGSRWRRGGLPSWSWDRLCSAPPGVGSGTILAARRAHRLHRRISPSICPLSPSPSNSTSTRVRPAAASASKTMGLLSALALVTASR